MNVTQVCPLQQVQVYIAFVLHLCVRFCWLWLLFCSSAARNILLLYTCGSDHLINNVSSECNPSANWIRPWMQSAIRVRMGFDYTAHYSLAFLGGPLFIWVPHLLFFFCSIFSSWNRLEQKYIYVLHDEFGWNKQIYKKKKEKKIKFQLWIFNYEYQRKKNALMYKKFLLN